MVLRRSRASPTAFFEELYAIVVGLGLALAVEQVIDLHTGGLPIRAEHLPTFLAYLNFSFALAHASVRYLQMAYGQREVSLTRLRVLADLVLGVGHFLWLLVLSFLISRPAAFAVAVVVLLIGRPMRDGLFVLTGQPRLAFDRKVAIVQLATVSVLGIALAVAHLVVPSAETPVMRASILITSILFGLGLYLWAFDYFFPATSDD